MFSKIILNWYQKNRRDLPWRHSSDPYVIWLSEIILQQTRVEQGLPYFERFLAAYPTIQDFAAAKEDDILHLWQGLGYYSRGRNMHLTALQIVNAHQGRFPTTYKELLQLKGVGQYTAAAIASFAYNEAVAVVDGNVYRLLARYFGIDTPIDSTAGKKEFWALAQSLIDPQQAGNYNQGTMEFGAIQCKPKNPDCSQCPLAESCIARIENKIVLLPVKQKKLASRNRYFDYLLISDTDSNYYIQKREQKDIWQHLYEFPLLESDTATEEQSRLAHIQNIVSEPFEHWEIRQISGWNKHLLSHQKILARFWHIHIQGRLAPQNSYQIVSKHSLNKFAFPQLINRYLHKNLPKP